MSNPSLLAAIDWENETTPGEVTATFSKGLDVLRRVDVSGLDHSKINPDRVGQYRGEGAGLEINGVMGGKITTEFYATGHESSCSGAGAATPTDRETLLGYILGLKSTPPAGTTFTGGTATAPTTTASATFPAGGYMRAGALNDGRGNGQFYPISTHPSTTMNLLGAMDAAPNNGDICYSPTLIYEPSDPTTTAVTCVRMRFLSGNLVFEAHAMHAEEFKITGLSCGETGAGEVPIISVTWDVGWWACVGSITNPSTVSRSTANPAPTAAGTFDLQDFATTTRNKLTVRNLSLTYNLERIAEYGPGTAHQFSRKTGARRIHNNARPQALLEFDLDADAQTATPTFDADWLTGTSRKRGTLTCSTADGSAFGVGFKSLRFTGKRPTQVDRNGKNVRRYQLGAYTGATLTSDLTRAPVVFLSA